MHAAGADGDGSFSLDSFPGKLNPASLPMENHPVSEHHRKLNLTTILLIALLVLLSSIGFAGSVFILIYGPHYGFGLVLDLIYGMIGILMGAGVGYIVLRFLRRMWAVKSIRLAADGNIEIVTWNGRSFQAKLPQDVRYAFAEKDGFTIGLRSGENNFVIDSLQLSNSKQASDLFRRFLVPDQPPGNNVVAGEK